MKRLAVTLCLVAAMALLPPTARTQSSSVPDAHPAVILCGALLIVAAGIVTVVGVVRMCRNIESNQNWNLTNSVGPEGLSLPPLFLDASANPSGAVHFQSSAGLGTVFNDEVSISLAQDGNTVIGVAARGGVPVLTNSAAIDTNGWSVLDFRSLSSTNGGPSGFWRLAQ